STHQQDGSYKEDVEVAADIVSPILYVIKFKNEINNRRREGQSRFRINCVSMTFDPYKTLSIIPGASESEQMIEQNGHLGCAADDGAEWSFGVCW
nr:hypothetical protein [Tanacetum cinerariifolium]